MIDMLRSIGIETMRVTVIGGDPLENDSSCMVASARPPSAMALSPVGMGGQSAAPDSDMGRSGRNRPSRRPRRRSRKHGCASMPG
jgi:hypothetical protein